MSESSQLPLLDALRRVTVRPRERREMAPFKALPRAPRSGIPGRGRGVVGVGRRGGRPLAGTAGVGRGGVAVPAAGCATSPGDRAWHCPRPARNRGRSAPPMLRAPPQAPPCLRAAFEHDSPAAGAVPAPASGRRASPPHHRTADDQDLDRTLRPPVTPDEPRAHVLVPDLASGSGPRNPPDRRPWRARPARPGCRRDPRPAR